MRLYDFFISWKNAFVSILLQLKSSWKDVSILEYMKSLFSEVYIIKQKLKDLKATNYNLGLMHYNSGRLSDAIMRFKMLKYFTKEAFPELDYYIGRCYVEGGQIYKAQPYLDEYLKSGDKKFIEEATFCINKIEGKEITQIPISLIKHNYDVIATADNKNALLSYHLQDEMYRIINSFFSEIGTPYGNRALDIGCGTGYFIELLKRNKIVGYAYGIDISSKMIEICQGLRTDDIICYDKLKNTNFKDEADLGQDYNLIIASDFIGHFTDVKDFFSKCAGCLRDNGIIIMSYRTCESQMAFDKTLEEFCYNSNYVQDLAKAAGLKIRSVTPVKFSEIEPGEILALTK